MVVFKKNKQNKKPKQITGFLQVNWSCFACGCFGCREVLGADKILCELIKSDVIIILAMNTQWKVSQQQGLFHLMSSVHISQLLDTEHVPAPGTVLPWALHIPKAKQAWAAAG